MTSSTVLSPTTAPTTAPTVAPVRSRPTTVAALSPVQASTIAQPTRTLAFTGGSPMLAVGALVLLTGGLLLRRGRSRHRA